jgi:hypothetical protein
VPPLPNFGEERAFEDLVTNFVVSEIVSQRTNPGTVASKLYGIRFTLLTQGGGDVFLRCPRVKMLVRSLKRLKRKEALKLPVTPEMLLWLARNLRLGQQGTVPVPDDLKIWAIICLSFFFLLRISEALALVFGDLQPRRGASYVGDWGAVDSVTVLISSSKTDQYNLGCLRTQSRVGGIMCPVGAVKALEGAWV